MANGQDAVEVELLSKSSSVNTATRGFLYGNMRRRKNGWEVRPGFGQVAQFDTLAATPASTNAPAYGYRKVLGSTVLLTSFGHYQIVTVLLARATVSSQLRSGPFQDCYCVSVYDVTADERIEELLFVQAKQTISSPEDMVTASVFYNQTANVNGATLVRGVDEPVSFAELDDNLLFCAPNLGLWCYSPVDPSGIPKTPQLDTFRGKWKQASPLGDSGRIFPIVPAPGNFAAKYPYLDSAAFPSPLSVCALGTIAVYGLGQTVYFAESLLPGSVAATQLVSCGSMQSDITAVAQKNGYIYIWGRNETWVYQPGEGTPVPGRLQQLSSSVGCLSQRAICQREDTLLWVSERGVHVLTDPMDIETISTPMKPLFDDSLGNPLSSYWTDNGGDTWGNEQPRVEWNWGARGDVTCAYDNLLRIVYIAVPEQNLVLTVQTADDGSDCWAVMSFETMVLRESQSSVGVNQTIVNPQVLSLDGKVWCISGLEQYDNIGMPAGYSTTSYVITEMGRGGAVDRTVYLTEDQRVGNGYFKTLFDATVGHSPGYGPYLLLDRPIVMPVGYKYPGKIAGETTETMLVPVRVLSPHPIVSILAVLNINTGWEPVLADNGSVALIFPPERRTSESCEQGGAAGPLWSIQWDASFNTGNTGPYTITSGAEETLYFIGFRWTRIDSSSGLEPTITGTPTLTYFNNGLNVTQNMSIVCYSQAWLMDRHTDDDTAQPIDWFAKSDQIGGKESSELRTRGTFIRLLTRGTGVPVYDTSTWIGTLNALATSDWKDWSMQVIDAENGGAPLVNKITVTNAEALANQPIRARLSVDPDVDPVRNLWGYRAIWEDALNPGAGNTLVGDEQLDTMSVSTATRGESISWMIFGSSINRAQHILLDSAKAVMRRVGQRRRWGR